MKSALSLATGDRQRLFWYLQALGWGGVLIVATGVAVYLPVNHAVILAVFRTVFGLAVTSFVLRPLFRRARRRKPVFSWARLAGLVLLCGFLGLADAAAVFGAARLLRADLEPAGMRQFLAFSIFMRSALYGYWSLLYFGIHAWLDGQQNQLRVAQAEAALRSSELQVLRSQVNPHFLFNALSAILSKSENPQGVRQTTLALAEYLRFSLSQRGDTEPLGVELAALENYLRVEKARFEEKLEYHIAADPRSTRAMAPVALVQPLLENAIKHGQRSPVRPLKVEISSRLENGRLVVTVTNTGRWIEPAGPASTGIGLANLRRRLELLYGDQASLTHEKENGWVRARVCLPAGLPS